jgi:transposase
LNQDNGPENNSRRTQFISRIVAFAHQAKLNIYLAYYPPYHSKYNPVERTFGWLEKHWNGSLLNSVKTVLEFAKTLTFNSCRVTRDDGKKPIVNLVETIYQTGVTLTK